MKVVIGVDVGSTFTDCAAVSADGQVVSKAKILTSEDVMSGVISAIQAAHEQLPAGSELQYLTIGTTAFLNAIATKDATRLSKVVVLRCCGESSRAVPPCIDFPERMRELCLQGYCFLDTCGHKWDGTPSHAGGLDEARVREQVREALAGLPQGQQVVVSGTFSTINSEHEETVGRVVAEERPDAVVTLSHKLMCGIGLLERENTAILNAALRPLAARTVEALNASVAALGLDCPVYMTHNDGSMMTSAMACEFPIKAVSSGTTNSMRGAAFLTGEHDAVVIDIGGATTDVGALVRGDPRPCAAETEIPAPPGVRVNMRQPDVCSVGIGGGSVVRVGAAGEVTVGPDSVGRGLLTESQTFGGGVLTATCTAVCARGTGALWGEHAGARRAAAGAGTVAQAQAYIKRRIEEKLDAARLSPEDVPVVLVGGGSIVLDPAQGLAGASRVVVPAHFDVVNAVGAAVSQPSGEVDRIVRMDPPPPAPPLTRAAALAQVERDAAALAVRAGAAPHTVRVIDTEVIPMPLAAGAERIRIKAVGSIAGFETAFAAARAGPAAAAPPAAAAAPPAAPRGALVRGATPPLIMSTVNACPETGLWDLTEADLDAIAWGAGVLGTGGGGDTHYSLVRAKAHLRAGHTISVLSPDALGAGEEVAPVAFLGAPTVLLEKLTSGREIDLAVNALGDNKRLRAYMSIEIGGMNGVEPLLAAALRGLPALDADLMGRAFPKVNMVLPALNGRPITPAAVADDTGMALVADTPAGVPLEQQAEALENQMREIAMANGLLVAIALPRMQRADVEADSIRYSVTKAWQLGTAAIRAVAEKRPPVQAIARAGGGEVIFEGKICDVHRFVDGGFNRGAVTLEGLAADVAYAGQRVRLGIQNENLVAERIEGPGSHGVLAAVPDLITILDTATGKTIFTERLRYGMLVSVVVLPAESALQTERALASVGPAAFGYGDVVYQVPQQP